MTTTETGRDQLTGVSDAAASASAQTRSAGIDVFRGAVMVGLAVLVFTPWTGWRGHPEWWGWRPSDVFFPFFLLVAGVGLALQTAREMPWARLLRRFAALVVVGLVVNALLGEGLDLAHLRIPGVLQRIALVGLAGAVVAAVLRRRWLPVTFAALFLALAWGLLLSYGSRTCPGGEPTSDGCGTFVELDAAVFGERHLYHLGASGHDPEGLASTLGATATFLAGFGAGRLTRDLRARSLSVRVGSMSALGLGWLAVTPVMLAFAPFGKRMWTPAFVSLNAAVALVVIALLMAAFDSRSRWPALEWARAALAWPFVAVGRNALLAWVSLFLIDRALDVTRTETGPLEAGLLDALGNGGYVVVLLGGWMALWCVMHLCRWHVRL